MRFCHASYIQEERRKEQVDKQPTSPRQSKSKELTLRPSASTYGITKSTLADHVHGESSKRYGGEHLQSLQGKKKMKLW